MSGTTERRAPLTPPGQVFFFIRHGETDWNRQGRLQGQRDTPLNGVGRDQAAAAGRMLRHVLQRRGVHDFKSLRYVASPLTRTRDTMALVLTAMGLEATGIGFDDRLREMSFGAWEGKTWPEVKAIAATAVKERKRCKWVFVPPGGESYAMLADRVRPWLETVTPFDVVVGHGGVARVLMHLLAGASQEAAPDLDVWQGRVMTFSHNSCHWD